MTMSMEKVGIIVGSTAAVRITAADIAVTNYITIPRAGGIICQPSKFASKKTKKMQISGKAM
jgi:hypothetical protein